MKFDMHVHTHHSRMCGWMRPRVLVRAALEKGLDGLAVTDHNTIIGALEAIDIVEEKQIALSIIVGEEISTPRGEVLAYFINNEIEPGPFEDVLHDIRKAGGVLAIPHPFDRIRKGFVDVEEIIEDVDAIEVLNSRCLFNAEALDLCQDHKKAALGGSDAHFYQEVGRAWTEYHDDPRSCILDGRTHVGGGLSNPAYLIVTKGLKVWRKATCGSV